MKTFTRSVLLSSVLVSTTAFASVFPLEAPKDIDAFITAGSSVSDTSATTAFVAALEAPKDVLDNKLDTSFDSKMSSVEYVFVNPLEAPKDRVNSGYCELNGHEVASENSNGTGWAAVRKQC